MGNESGMSELASLAGEVLWSPGEDEWRNSNLANYMRWLPETGRPEFTVYQDLWRWSVDNLEDFWRSIWEYYDVKSSREASVVLQERTMPGAKWFPGAQPT